MDFPGALKKHFGYSEFRPLQEEIVRDALAGRDVFALLPSGIAATFLNSTLERHEAVARLRGLHHGKYRLLYVAPERLMLDNFLERALNWDIAQIAIDEAHCI